MISVDINKDGKKDIILAGNFYPFRTQMGPLDAGIGLVLKNNGNGSFATLDYSQTHLYIPGDVRNIITVKSKNSFFVVAAKNNGALQILKPTF